MNKYYFNVGLKVLADFFSVPLIIVLAYSLKFKIGWFFNYFFDYQIGVIYHHAQVEPYLKHIVVMSLSVVAIFFIMGVYKRFDGVMFRVEETFSLIRALSVSIFVLLISSLIYDIFPNSRGVMLNGWFIALLIMILSRKVIDSITRLFFPFSDENIILIGTNQKSQVLLEGLYQSRKKINYLGTYSSKVPSDMILFYKEKFNHLGPITEAFFSDILDKKVNTVYLDPDECSAEKLEEIVLFCETKKISVNIIQNNKFTLHGSLKVTEFAGVTMISYPTFYFKNSTKLIKRMFDVVVAFFSIIILLPILSIIGVWIKVVSSEAPIIYKQERTGRDNKPFKMLKFRTVIPDAESSTGPIWANKNEDRYIKGGNVLRKYSLDELPQLINVLFGDMSIVGPRPERPYFVDKICEEVPHFKLRHTVKGGLTGWAQIHGRAYMTNRPAQKIAYDLYYISNWSFGLDLKIIIKTFFLVIKGEQAY
ncbi:MAG: hypothetical protein CMP39_00105 [Rickettsiales bacterium]|nr:hypothetical protein [Rickettsiales bacterium]